MLGNFHDLVTRGSGIPVIACVLRWGDSGKGMPEQEMQLQVQALHGEAWHEINCFTPG